MSVVNMKGNGMTMLSDNYDTIPSPEDVFHRCVTDLIIISYDDDISHLSFLVGPTEMRLVARGEQPPSGVTTALPARCTTRLLLTALCLGKSSAVAAVAAMQQIRVAADPQKSQLASEAWEHLAQLLRPLILTEFRAPAR
jgi:hypothetical protein